jgi:CHAT domain-containing protein
MKNTGVKPNFFYWIIDMRYISVMVISAIVMTMGLPRVSELQAQTPSTASSAEDKYPIDKAREKLKLAEAAHPEGSVEVVDAISDLVFALRVHNKVDEESFALVEKELTLAEKLAGAESSMYVNALMQKSKAFSYIDKNAEARPIAEKALEIAKRKYSDQSIYPQTATSLLRICIRLGDFECGLRAADDSIEATRKGIGGTMVLVSSLSQRAELKYDTHDVDGAVSDIEEALAIAYKNNTDDYNLGMLERNLGDMCIRAQKFDKAMPHLDRAKELITKAQGAESPELKKIEGFAADLYTRTGQFDKAWKSYQIALDNKNDSPDNLMWYRTAWAQSYAAGGKLTEAIEQGLQVEKSGRETFVLEARTLPERQALAYDQHHPRGLNIALSVLAKHPELSTKDIYQEVVRSRALVADEMARREKNLNTLNDPEVAKELEDLNKARLDLLNAEKSANGKDGKSESIVHATERMETIERTLAEKSAAIRNDEHLSAVQINDLRQELPPHSALISYVVYKATAIEKVDPARSAVYTYMAFVLRPDSDRIRVFDLGEMKSVDDFIGKMRASADSEAHSKVQGSIRNERAYREAGEGLRKRIWDPLSEATKDAQLLLVVPDGLLNLVPFAALPSGDGYLVEKGPVVHMLTSERDLLSEERNQKKTGLLVLGGPAFDEARVIQTATTAQVALPSASSAPLRGETIDCDEFQKMIFPMLPAATEEAHDIADSWKKWNQNERLSLLTGAEATRDRFLAESESNRVLHIATHAFILNRSCGNGNPLLHSGLVFAGANQNRDASILTAQQIASLDLSGVDWAVLSACNTGNGELADGEGVLGLERAFRVAGAGSVIMSLWTVDDEVTRQYMRELYLNRFANHASTADAAWLAARHLLENRRTAHQSTHPWYWADFVAAGDWR